MHIISVHLGDYFRRTGKTLLSISDEHVEAVNSAFQNIMKDICTKSGIWTKKPTTKKKSALLSWNS